MLITIVFQNAFPVHAPIQHVYRSESKTFTATHECTQLNFYQLQIGLSIILSGKRHFSYFLLSYRRLRRHTREIIVEKALDMVCCIAVLKMSLASPSSTFSRICLLERVRYSSGG